MIFTTVLSLVVCSYMKSKVQWLCTRSQSSPLWSTIILLLLQYCFSSRTKFWGLLQNFNDIPKLFRKNSSISQSLRGTDCLWKILATSSRKTPSWFHGTFNIFIHHFHWSEELSPTSGWSCSISVKKYESKIFSLHLLNQKIQSLQDRHTQ